MDYYLSSLVQAIKNLSLFIKYFIFNNNFSFKKIFKTILLGKILFFIGWDILVIPIKKRRYNFLFYNNIFINNNKFIFFIIFIILIILYFYSDPEKYKNNK
jgi:hypothetical protein